jgi:hypothetical protein
VKIKPFKRYEYKLFEFQAGCLYSEEMVKALNKIGVQGWKLVKGPDETGNLTPDETGKLTGEWYVGLFVREKQ